jgi:hypothetical protein
MLNHESRFSESGYSHVRRFKMQARLSVACEQAQRMIAARMAGDTAAKRRWIQL